MKTNTFTIAPYARYSFLQSDLIKLFVDGGFGFSTAKVKGSDAANSWNIGWKPGLAIKLSDRFCLVAKYGFLGYSQDETPMGTKTKNFGLDLDTDELPENVSCIISKVVTVGSGRQILPLQLTICRPF